MKKIISAISLVLLASLFISLTSSAQVLKFKTTSFSSRYVTSSYKTWTNWSPFERVSMLIVMNLDEERLTIYSKETQVYDILETLSKGYDKDGDYTFKFLCINEDGLRCHIRLVKLESQDNQLQFYVDFKDMMWVYNVYNLR